MEITVHVSASTYDYASGHQTVFHCMFGFMKDPPVLCCTYLHWAVQGMTKIFLQIKQNACTIPFVDTLHSKNGGNLSQILFLSSLSLFLVSAVSIFPLPITFLSPISSEALPK
jgi:hypothetical protein